MKHLNCSVVFNQHKEKVLFCKRKEEPYKGLYNLVGGRVEPGEKSFGAAYREIQEETGTGRANVEVLHKKLIIQTDSGKNGVHPIGADDGCDML